MYQIDNNDSDNDSNISFRTYASSTFSAAEESIALRSKRLLVNWIKVQLIIKWKLDFAFVGCVRAMH